MRINTITILAAAVVSITAGCATIDGSRGITDAYVEGDRVIVKTVSDRTGDFPKENMCTWAHINIDQEERYWLSANNDSTERRIAGVKIDGLECPKIRQKRDRPDRTSTFVRDTGPTTTTPGRGSR